MKAHRTAWIIAWCVLAAVFAFVALGAGIAALAIYGDTLDVLWALGVGGIIACIAALFVAGFPL